MLILGFQADAATVFVFDRQRNSAKQYWYGTNGNVQEEPLGTTYYLKSIDSNGFTFAIDGTDVQYMNLIVAIKY